MPRAKPTCQPQVRRSPAVRVCLEQIIACLQDLTDDDQAVVAAVVGLMRQGHLRGINNGWRHSCWIY